jgi:transcriptional regulator with PAS, ATPase and Fis domain
MIMTEALHITNTPNNELEPLFMQLIRYMDQGILVLDNHGNLLHANPPALKNLQISPAEATRLSIDIRSLIQETSSMETAQHAISVNGREALIVGQLYCGEKQKLFLMSFYQPHIPETSYESNSAFDGVIGESERMRRLKTLITRIAPGPSSVLINGESGTGKEVIANTIHKLSNRAHNPFIAINCAAIPDQLLESELFGYTKGAFTGASSKGRIGLIQAANKGTLFLDEIGDMSLQLQAKLLRVLETREVMPVGSNTPIPVDIRIISATNRNFMDLIAQNSFREDLYYRLNVIPLHLPPLRERQGDIHLLINYFMEIHTRKLGVAYPGMTQETLNCLNRYPWPGNVRELSNLVEYLINIVPEGDQISLDLLPPQYIDHSYPERAATERRLETTGSLPTSNHTSGKLSLEELEKRSIEDAIARLNSRQEVADELGIGIATLYRKIKKYGLGK